MMSRPRVSVVITAFNAADTIGMCLESMGRQEGFAPGDIEVLLVDDRSTDGTREAARATQLDGLRILRIEPPALRTPIEASALTMRQRALDMGISEARGDVICVTDADAVARHDWVRHLAGPCLRGEADVVTAPVSFRGGSALMRAFQTVDAPFYLAWCRIVAGLGFQSGALFGSCAFTRRAYAEVGGFERIGPSLVEDLAFARAAATRGLRITVLWQARADVLACGSLADFTRRAQRTSRGGASTLFAALALWTLSLPILVILAVVSGHRDIAMVAVMRYVAGVLLTGTATVAAGGWRASWMVPLYDMAAVLLGVFVLTRRPAVVCWGGMDYRV